MIIILNFMLSAFLYLVAGGNLAKSEINTLEETLPVTKVEMLNTNISSLYDEMNLVEYDLDYDAFRYGMTGMMNLHEQGKLQRLDILTIIDFNKSSVEPRFYTIDLKDKKLLFHSLVAHGQGSGMEFASNFSDQFNSHQSSLGFYMTAETYSGKHGYSLRLDGMEEGFNSNARPRAVVVHKAGYVSKDYANRNGRLGRSWGCPALPLNISDKVIDTIKDKTAFFIYHKGSDYLKKTNLLSYNG